MTKKQIQLEAKVIVAAIEEDVQDPQELQELLLNIRGVLDACADFKPLTIEELNAVKEATDAEIAALDAVEAA